MVHQAYGKKVEGPSPEVGMRDRRGLILGGPVAVSSHTLLRCRDRLDLVGAAAFDPVRPGECEERLALMRVRVRRRPVTSRGTAEQQAERVIGIRCPGQTRCLRRREVTDRHPRA
jgi:hypothetical protein